MRGITPRCADWTADFDLTDCLLWSADGVQSDCLHTAHNPPPGRHRPRIGLYLFGAASHHLRL